MITEAQHQFLKYVESENDHVSENQKYRRAVDMLDSIIQDDVARYLVTDCGMPLSPLINFLDVAAKTLTKNTDHLTTRTLGGFSTVSQTTEF